jgi:hypothetical protein
MKLIKFTMPMNRRNSLRVVGRTICLMASIFLGIDCIPELLIKYCRYSNSSAQKVDFPAFTRNPLSDNNLKQLPFSLDDFQEYHLR